MVNSFKYTLIILAKNNDEILAKKVNELTSCSINNFYIIVANYGSIFLPLNNRIKVLNNCVNGIYDSMNQAISHVSTEYYIVLGLDDEILIYNLDKINFEEINQDILICNVIKNKKKYTYFKPRQVIFGPTGVFPSHTVGLLIKTSLHKKYGLYSLRFKVISDCYFISKSILGGCTYKSINITSGVVGSSGYSYQNQFLSEKECLEVRKEFGLNLILNYYLYLFRIIRRFLKYLVYKSYKNI